MKSYTYFIADDFIKREINSFEMNVDTVIDEIRADNFKEVMKKTVAVFGGDREAKADGTTVKLGAIPPSVSKITIPGAPFVERHKYTYGDLVEIIRRLRDPDGCPWDRAQTHESIRSNAVEEAYELAEAVDMASDEKMLEESGDVMLQGLFHAAIAEDRGAFSFDDVVNALCTKLVFRHTHIFGDRKANDPEEALKNWEAAKAVEKGYTSLDDKIKSVPVTFGALMRAYKVQKIIKKTGFDFSDVSGAVDKIKEEVAEFEEASGAEREKEGGDVLFAAVNALRMAGIDPEVALNGTTARFIRRFAYVEKRCNECGIELSAANIDKMEEFYQESKKLTE